ncbi:LacI family DNA-binding transcriptional regulator [Cohnella sp. 56]|uniref:LacI family DNA-binding transcriptional regulator n=1 Tax=Cohnella sp. 56 TaxID=3113722 RepID=UPI0030EAF413
MRKMDSYDIARLAGVSRKTVQRVLNNAASVKPATRDKVLRVMQEHHYEPNSAARQLSSRKANTMGLFIVQDKPLYTLHTDDLFYGPIIGAIISRCAELGYTTLVSVLDLSDIESLFSMYRQKSIDGGFIVSWSDLRPVIDRMAVAGFKVGLFDEGFYHAPEVPIPHLDNRRSARDAARYLLELGHRDIGILTGDMNNFTAQERLKGYTEALRERGIEPAESRICYGQFTEEDGVRAVERWLAAGDLPKALLCSNDLMAYGALKALSGRGVSVPDDISVVGFDDLLVSQYTYPPLTTMKVPRVDMAVHVADCLVALVEEREPPAPEQFVASLTERQSCAPARPARGDRQIGH